MRYFLSSKEQEISYFCQRRVSVQKDPEKRIYFWRLDYKFTERKVASLKQYGGL